MVKGMTKHNSYAPKMNLRLFVQALLSPEVMGDKMEAERVTGVGRHVFYWHLKRTPAFRDWYREQCRLVFDRYLPATVLSLQKAATKSGDVRAILAILEIAGMYKPKGDVEVNLGIGIGGQMTPENPIIFADVKPTNGDDEHRDGNGAKGLYAPKGSNGPCKRLPL